MIGKIGTAGSALQTFFAVITWPFRKLLGWVLMILIATVFLLWLGGFMGEKLLGVETLPSMLAPERMTPQKKLEDDEIECVMYNVLVDMKGAHSHSKGLERKVIKTILAYGRIYDVRQCDVFQRAMTLVPHLMVRDKQERELLYVRGEFVLKTQQKRALQEEIRVLIRNPDYSWTATNYIRPDRTDFAGKTGNQTQAERNALFAQMVVIPKSNDPDESEFQFFAPKKTE